MIKINSIPTLFGLLLLIGVGIFVTCKSEVEKTEMTEKAYPVEKVKPKATIRAHPFNMKQVRLLEGPFKETMERDRKYLHVLESDRLMHMFRVNAGLPSSAEPLAGWERPDCELRGHSLGHYLSACALMYASTGDEELKSNADAIVAELAKCQKALGPSGYLSAYPEEFIDRVEAIKEVWAPYYTLHKIFAGLLDMYVHCGNRQALGVAEGMASWVKMRTDRLNEEHMQGMLDHTEQGGINEAFSNLYALTGNPEHLKLARRFDQKSYTEPLSKYQDQLKGLHANSLIPNIIGTAREYELTGDRVLQHIATYFWEQITRTRCFATGGTSNNEKWESNPYHLSNQISRSSHESCCTYNMLKLTRYLFSWDPKPCYADYYERALFNGILPTQNPEDGMMMYYVPMASGLYKTFMKPRSSILDWTDTEKEDLAKYGKYHGTSFWCCTGTGMENHAKYGDSIYFHDEQGVFVNLFIASELNWSEKGVHIRQETNFPEEEGTTLIIVVDQPTEFTVHIRIPYWVEKEGQVKINSKLSEIFSSPGSYLTLKRTWRDGDRIEVNLPMDLHLHRMPDDPQLAAIMYGPLVLAGQLGKENITKEKIYGYRSPTGDPVPVPYFVADDNDLDSWIKPVADGPLMFRTVNAGRPKDVTLVPFYKLFGQRYAIYWKIHP
jgi:DUF1680 family protein